MDDITRRILRDPADVRKIQSGRELFQDEQESWVRSHNGKSTTVEVNGVKEEWMVVESALRNEGGKTILKAVVNKKVLGKVSSFEMTVPELVAKNLIWK